MIRQSITQNKKGSQQKIFSKTSDPFSSYEHSIEKKNTMEYVEKFQGTNSVLWAFGRSILGHTEQARKEANRIKRCQY